MPNWCNTSISFEVHDESQKCMDALKDFYYKIKNQLDSGTSLGENGFGSSWLGNFYILFGIVVLSIVYFLFFFKFIIF